MSNNYEKNSIPRVINVYIKGSIPSIRESQMILSMIECSTVWSAISLLKQEYARCEKILSDANYINATNEQKHEAKKAKPIRDELKKIIEPLDNSFMDYLLENYKPVIYEAIIEMGFSESKYLFSFPKSLERQEFDMYHHEIFKSPSAKMKSFLLKRSLGKPDFQFGDFYFWIGEKFGENLFETKQISTANSFNVVFDIGILIGILGLQEYPFAKDILTYMK